MINLFFFLKFKTQLRRTRPDIVNHIDESLIRLITDSGGKITGDRLVISAVFNEKAIGFWLDVYILIENLRKSIEAFSEFFGYSLVISSRLPDSPEMLCRFLANHGGVFLDKDAAKKFIPYAVFEKPSEWLKEMKRPKYGCGSYFRIKELKVFKKSARNELNLQKYIVSIFEHDKEKNKLILGTLLLQIRCGLYDYCNKLTSNFPPLIICFGSVGLGALVDAWSLSIRSLDTIPLHGSKEGSGGLTEEIDNLWEFLFRERINDEVSEYVIRCVKRFLRLVFNFYFNVARKKKRTPVLVLENIHLAGNIITEILIDTLAEINPEDTEKLTVLGTGESGISPEKLLRWESVFKKAKMIEKQNQIFYPKLSDELWEIVYAVSLFGRYFSPELIQKLLNEDEKNPVMITRAFSILHNLGIINSTREPRIMNGFLEEYACEALGDRTAKVRELVCERLLSWAKMRNLSPCFRLLTIIAGLDGVKKIDDLLLLKSILSDIINETTSGIETAIMNGQFEELVSVKASAIRYIFNTSRALHCGRENDIERAFAAFSAEDLNAGCDPYPVLKTQILVNLGAYYLSHHNRKDAVEKTKEAILLGQDRNTFCLPQSYRIFSLLCLSKQKAVETIEYLGFALTSAEKTGNYHELAISSYYAAAAQFLYGDIYNAARLVRKSIEHSLDAGRCEWADRSLFLEGRIKFELGHYSAALEIFEALLKWPYGSKTYEKDNLLAAWIYRCKIYFQDPGIPKPEAANHDANLFEIEAAYFSGDYQKTVELSGSLSNPFSKENFLYTEQADWRSGFAQCEHLYFTHGEIQDRMICMFHSLALSRLSPQGNEKAKQNIQQILRDERLCEMDPCDAFYFYTKYLILKQGGANTVDMSTAVSMAFKRLQRRAGRIEDIETCRQYLNGPRWNRELSLTAKEFKLI
ncbi:MAG: hypothetical protein LBQ89_06845 [Treponema sp.]|jgi:hypothetical protein|nr:hypothetical protein [Treponema sp.]